MVQYWCGFVSDILYGHSLFYEATTQKFDTSLILNMVQHMVCETS